MRFISRLYKNKLRKTIIFALISVIFYNEYLVYVLQPYSWPELVCKNKITCIRILLVSDPQLIGEINEKCFPPLAIWDSDRFLKKTYDRVVQHTKPQVIIFLGDLFDEGSISSRKQFHQYTQRFFNIFDTTYPIKHIWLPGDNDVGGEEEVVSKEKLRLFNATFRQPSSMNFGFVTFSIIIRMLSEFTVNNDINYQNKTSILLSHMPLVLVSDIFVDKMFQVFRPKLIFAGHQHSSVFIEKKARSDFGNMKVYDIEENKILQFKLSSELIREIIVPTCSYRMGTDNIGYGAALIDHNEEVKYALLRSPSRFKSLYIYLWTLLVVMVLFLYDQFLKCRYRYTVYTYGNVYYKYKHII